jgi:hypothetical protein
MALSAAFFDGCSNALYIPVMQNFFALQCHIYVISPPLYSILILTLDDTSRHPIFPVSLATIPWININKLGIWLVDKLTALPDAR